MAKVITHLGKEKAYNNYPPARSIWKDLYVGAGTASGAALGFIIGNIPGAIIGGKLGYELSRSRLQPE